MKNQNLIIFLLVSLSTNILRAQLSVNSTGSNASGTGGSVSYSVGQMVYTSHQGLNGSVSQGVQQAYKITDLSTIDADIINISITFYPNPTSDLLTLFIDNQEIENFTYQLYDLHGKFLKSEKILTKLTNISLVNFFPSNYFVRVYHGNREVKVIQITKN